ncbi:molybdenum cofactor guanylyltransferase [Pyrococcus furiosus DSM 3638]|uniref:Molybdenum cofactor guanylyltransferase n=3 Tax=Pyrococcus furiosus TaxID=2261 RepID=A0A5C0XSI4_PYRFU|nr:MULTISPECIES: hypothetical protein [Pyrococcus]AAL82165.1 hypothetical protein PF2041 [Pyrococcus furiosus DSM 3638]AFN04602.1 hypothetical protein PFC_08360 [Pyrococcus furiosus COM1]MDK2870016.1 hypothetical protein [Pyrococcus sp.]QEK79731.1 molybdenum cofactor guanylyltransferase [Pyrococcus furiosus DSM 3638]
MLGVIFAVKLKKSDNYLIPINDESVVKIVEARLRLAKRIDDVVVLVKKSQERKFSLHVENVVPVTGNTKIDALLKGLPKSGDIFLVEGNMPLVMPFLINYMTSIYYDEFLEALIPRFRENVEVFHGVYNARALRNALEGMKADNISNLSKLPEYIDAEFLDVEELMRKNEKVKWSFFRVKTLDDIRTVLRSGLLRE